MLVTCFRHSCDVTTPAPDAPGARLRRPLDRTEPLELGAMGYRMVLFANTAMRVAAAAVRDAFGELRRTGDSTALLDTMLSWDERQALVGLAEIESLERRYAPSPSAPARSGERMIT